MLGVPGDPESKTITNLTEKNPRKLFRLFVRDTDSLFSRLIVHPNDLLTGIDVFVDDTTGPERQNNMSSITKPRDGWLGSEVMRGKEKRRGRNGVNRMC